MAFDLRLSLEDVVSPLQRHTAVLVRTERHEVADETSSSLMKNVTSKRF